jgi:predicted 2-oxoglutarate/Fe(II)-dependent dioxygenase YbiX
VNIVHLGAGVSTIDGFLSADECATYIAHGERLGYAPADIQTEGGPRHAQEVRNNDRVVLDDTALALTLFEHARSVLPPTLDNWALCGFNERLRYYRYDVGQQFDWHLDGSVRVGEADRSRLTFMIYLNDDFDGGSTDFGWESVKPLRGRVLVFPHHLRHRGAVVQRGVKYVLRTDVMYRLPENLRRAI